MILNNRILLNEEKGVIEIIFEPKQHCEWNVALLFYSITIRELLQVYDHADMTLTPYWLKLSNQIKIAEYAIYNHLLS